MILSRGATFVSAAVVDGRLVLTREDGSVRSQPVYFVSGSLVDNEDDLTFSLGS